MIVEKLAKSVLDTSVQYFCCVAYRKRAFAIISVVVVFQSISIARSHEFLLADSPDRRVV